jgi:ribosomal protein S1
MEQTHSLKRNDIIVASVADSLGEPVISEIQGYEDYTASIKQPEVLSGMDSVELRVLEVDEDNKKIKVGFHAMVKFNPMVSTPRAIYVTYQSMQNTVSQIFRKLF